MSSKPPISFKKKEDLLKKPQDPTPAKFDFGNFVNAESLAFYKRYVIVVFAILFSCFVLFITYGTPEAQTKHFYYYLFLCTFPILIAMYLVSPLYTEKMTKLTMFLYGGTTIVVLVALYYFYQLTNPASVSLISTFSSGFIFLGFFVGLAILYRVLMRYINMTRGWFGFLLQLLFYIPCLIIEFVQGFMDELKVAPNIVFVLVVIEILIVLSYLYLPKLLMYLRKDSEHILIDSPVFLNKPHVVAKNEDFLLDKKRKDMPEKTDDVIRANYSIAFWVFVNEQSINDGNKKNILSYSSPGSYIGKPTVKYQGGNLYFTLTDSYASSAAPISLPIPNQKWNYVVITYDDQKADVFLNGVLKYSDTFSNDMYPHYFSTDVIQVGQIDGVYGAIRSLVYYKNPIHLAEVVNTYNILKYTTI